MLTGSRFVPEPLKLRFIGLPIGLNVVLPPVVDAGLFHERD